MLVRRTRSVCVWVVMVVMTVIRRAELRPRLHTGACRWSAHVSNLPFKMG